MKWEKLGRIFEPTQYKLPNNCFEFAKSPQVIVFEDYIRVYYCSAEKGIEGKIYSHVLFVDYTKDFSKIIGQSSKEVISLGELGTFDEHGIFPFNVLKDDDIIKAYITGWSRRVSVSVETSIGYAESHDNGLTFSRLGLGPILSSSLHEPFLVCDGFVLKEHKKYYMFYIFGTKWAISKLSGNAERVYKIALAFSDDGLNWERNSQSIIENVIGEDECQALPTVLKIEERYHMYFCYRHMDGFRSEIDKGYRLGYAYSDDLKSWHRNDSFAGITLSEVGWDSLMMCYPHVFKVENEIYMLYNGNEFGKYGFGLAKLIEF